jgi:hypothetical protein
MTRDEALSELLKSYNLQFDAPKVELGEEIIVQQASAPGQQPITVNSWKLNLVEDPDLLLNKGDALVYTNPNGLKQLMMICPGCGRASASAGSHVYNEQTRSYYPSIVHNVALGGCGWHGWLINGIFSG